MRVLDSTASCSRIVCAAALLLLSAACGGGSSLPTAAEETPQSAAPAGVAPALWQELTAELARATKAYGTDKAPASAPIGAGSRVSDLWLFEDGGGAQLVWHYRNQGDYDHNNNVNISDLVPVGQHFGKDTTAADWLSAQRADGDHNGVVNIADVTPIGQNFGAQLDGYELQTRPIFEPAAPWQTFDDMPALNFVDPGGYAKYIRFIPAPQTAFAYRVVPYEIGPSGHILGEPSAEVAWQFFLQQIWPMVGGNPQHTGHAEYSGPTAAEEEWTLPLEGHLLDYPPAIDYFSNIYVTTHDPTGSRGWLNCISHSGALSWRYEFADKVFLPPTLLSDGTIIVTTAGGEFFQITNDGKLLWQDSMQGNAITTSPLTSNGQFFYAADSTPRVYFGNADNDSMLAFPINGSAGTSVFVYPGELGIIEQDGTIWELNAETSNELGQQVFYSVVVDETLGYLLVPYFSQNSLAALSIGGFPWTFNTAGHITGAPSLMPNGAVYVGTEITGSNPSTGRLYRLNPGGTEDWNTVLGAAPDTDIITDIDGTAFFGAITQGAESGMYAFESDMSLSWTYFTPERLPKTPAFGGPGRVVFVADTPLQLAAAALVVSLRTDVF